MIQQPRTADRWPLVAVIVIPFLVYAYFFQGIAWNAMSHFDTIRAMAERGSAEIHATTEETGDVCIVNGRLYSNKPPGLPLLGVLPYRLIIAVERSLHIDIQSPFVVSMNLRACTILLAALPAALLNGLIYYAFRRDGAGVRGSLLLSGGFAFGSLSWPYAGHMMSHPLCALLVFGAWLLLASPRREGWIICVAGMLAAYAAFTDLLILPVTLSLSLILILRRERWRWCAGYCLSCCAGAVLVLVYNRWVMGSFRGGALVPVPILSKPDLLFGQFDWPEWRRLYWITLQPMRGLFQTCPEFAVCCLALWTRDDRQRIRPSRWVIVAVLGVYVVFYMTYFGWHGGASVGPRYLIPALPLLWMFARRPFEKLPTVCGILIALSIFQMLAVAAVGMLFPASITGLPDDSDPIRSDITVLIQGHVNHDVGTENLGGLMHVPERLQLVPIFALLATFYIYAWTQPRTQPLAIPPDAL